jgi:uncharacterized protein GlcG (DUF336 family)
MSTNIYRGGAVATTLSIACLPTSAANGQLKGREGHRNDCRRDVPSEGFRVSATLVNRDGYTIVLQLRGDGASPHTVENSRRKAYTANTFRTDTTAYTKRLNDGDPVVRQQVSLPSIIAIGAGVPIKAADEVIGGVVTC